MYCTRCGVELREGDRFCSQCGGRTAADAVAVVPARTLMLDKRNKKIAGVCAGVARYFGVDVILVRVIWLGLALGVGVGFMVYIAAWIVIPSDYGRETSDAIATAPQVV
jgi:phage shock protein C